MEQKKTQTLADAISAAEFLGHEKFISDPPRPLSRTSRFTCECCGRAILICQGHIYGSVLDSPCIEKPSRHEETHHDG